VMEPGDGRAETDIVCSELRSLDLEHLRDLLRSKVLSCITHKQIDLSEPPFLTAAIEQHV
jgi:hypothetical protein